MPSCIICHTEIDESVEKSYECPLGHPAHESCLGEWILHSENCPLCSKKYDSYIIGRCKAYLAKKEEEREGTLEERLLRQKKEKIEKISMKIIFQKRISEAEELINNKEYDKALDILFDLENTDLVMDKMNFLLFLKGKTFFLKGRYDMAIGHLFKLVKDEFDFPEAFLYLGKAYEKLGLTEKAKWAFQRAK